MFFPFFLVSSGSSLCSPLHLDVPFVSPNFLKRSHQPILLFPSISLHCSLNKTVLISPRSALELYIRFGTSFPFFVTFCFSSFSATCKASSDKYFAFLHVFLLGWIWSLSSVQCYESCSWFFKRSVYQILSLELTCNPHCIIIRNLI